MTTREDIKRWIATGINEGAQWMIVVCDRFDYEDYPVYCKSVEEFDAEFPKYNGVNMQKIMEVYDFYLDFTIQLNERRAWNFPPKSQFSFMDVKAG